MIGCVVCHELARLVSALIPVEHARPPATGHATAIWLRKDLCDCRQVFWTCSKPWLWLQSQNGHRPLRLVASFLCNSLRSGCSRSQPGRKTSVTGPLLITRHFSYTQQVFRFRPWLSLTFTKIYPVIHAFVSYRLTNVSSWITVYFFTFIYGRRHSSMQFSINSPHLKFIQNSRTL